MLFQKQHPAKLVLASASPRRSELLKRLGLNFEICPADVDEYDSATDDPVRMVLKNAALKAEALSSRFADSLVLGSDTTVVLGEVAMGKPVDMDEARAMLKRLSSREHTVYTAVSLRWLDEGYMHDFVESSQVCFKELDVATIDAYFAIVNPLDKAGSYGIQEGRDRIIDSVNGSVENVMGLPIQALERHLMQQGFDFKD